MKYLWNRWMDLHQIQTEDVFGPSLEWVWMSRSKVKFTRDIKQHFSALLVACMHFVFGKTSLLYAVNCGRFCFWCHHSVFFCLCVKYLRNCWMNMHQIHTEDVFHPLLGWVWRSKVKVTRDKKRHFLALLVAGVRFIFGKTSLASSFLQHATMLALHALY